MGLEQQIMTEMKEAMRSKDEGLLRGLRAIKAEIIKAKTEPGAGGVIDEATEQKFLPKQLSESEIKAAVEKIIADTGAGSPADMGKVMGVASKQLAGRADGKTISNIVKELLSK